MHRGEPHLLAQGVRPLKVRVGFAGKADDDVGGDRHALHGLPDILNGLHVPAGGVAPAHALQHVIASTLQREVEVRT